VDVQVQGEAAPEQITRAIEYFSQLAEPPDVVVVTRGGGSAEDLYAFSTEQVTRAVAASRVPTLVAIGHEIDISLAELAADQRASTPSNAAELLVPHYREVQQELAHTATKLDHAVESALRTARYHLEQADSELAHALQAVLVDARSRLGGARQLLEALNPGAVLARGFAIVRKDGQVVRSSTAISSGDIVNVELGEGSFSAKAE
jgi:exodeoxyribonuclease VII large subunit